MRILQVITTLLTGGAENLVAQISPLIRDRGHDVEVACFVGTGSIFMKRLREAGIKVHVIRESGSVYDPRIVPELRALMKGFDVVHSHNTSAQYFTAIAGRGLDCKLVTTEHNTYNRRRNLPLFSWIDRRMYDRYDAVICITDKVRANLSEHVGRLHVPVVTIENGVDIDRFAGALPSVEITDKFRGKRLIAQVAAFRPQKDQAAAIRGMRYLPERFHLLLVGDGPLRSECEKLSESEGVGDRVHFLGVRDDVPSVLKAVDYVVMSSKWEGFGLAAVEGMAAGKPVLATNVDGLKAIVAGAGILFEAGDSEDLSRRIMSLDSDKDLYKATAARCLAASKRYGIDRMVARYCKVYEALKSGKIPE